MKKVTLENGKELLIGPTGHYTVKDSNELLFDGEYKTIDNKVVKIEKDKVINYISLFVQLINIILKIFGK